MQQVNLGKTGLMVSRIGLGTVKIGRTLGLKYPKQFELPTDMELDTLIKVSRDLGINVLDTAPAYGNSEYRIGKCLRKIRSSWNIFTKAGEQFSNGTSHYDFSPKALETSLRSSLKNLNTDYVDCLLLHSDGNDLQILSDERVLYTLEGFKRRGLVRAVGMSTRTVEGGLKAAGLLDVVMIAINPTWTKESVILDKAKTQNCGVIAKKILNSGNFNECNRSPAEAVRFVLGHDAVNCAVVGTINCDHLRENVNAVSALPLSRALNQRKSEYARHARPDGGS